MARISTSFRRWLRIVERIVSRRCEALWSAVFACLNRVKPRYAAAWTPCGGEPVLVIAPHPDDEVVGCGGSVLRHIGAGDRVCVAIATDGRQSRFLADPAAVAATRRREAAVVALLLGVAQLEWLNLPEGEWLPDQMAQRLLQVIERWQPAVIYAPSCIDYHPEHRRVAEALAVALSTLRASPVPRIRIYAIQVPLGYALTNLLCDVSATEPSIRTATQLYASQAANLGWATRRRRYTALRHRVGHHAEEFWELSAADYATLQRAAGRLPRASFRGLRRGAVTDPLAYLVGSYARRRFAKALVDLAFDEVRT